MGDPEPEAEEEAPQEPRCELVLKISSGAHLGDGSEEWPSKVTLQFPGEEEECTTEEMQGDSPAYEFTQTFPRDFSQETYDMMAQTTLTATIYTGEEVYGTVALDLIDLLKGATQVGGEIPVTLPPPPEDAPEPEELDEDAEPPPVPSLTMELSIASGEALFSEEELSCTNFLTVSAGSG